MFLLLFLFFLLFFDHVFFWFYFWFCFLWHKQSFSYLVAIFLGTCHTTTNNAHTQLTHTHTHTTHVPVHSRVHPPTRPLAHPRTGANLTLTLCARTVSAYMMPVRLSVCVRADCDLFVRVHVDFPLTCVHQFFHLVMLFDR